MIAQVLLLAFAAAIVIAALAVTGRLAWCVYRALRASRIGVAALSGFAIGGLIGLLAAVVFVWFGYGVAHSRKDLWSDLAVVLITGVPFFAASFGLWRLASYFQSALSRPQSP